MPKVPVPPRQTASPRNGRAECNKTADSPANPKFVLGGSHFPLETGGEIVYAPVRSLRKGG